MDETRSADGDAKLIIFFRAFVGSFRMYNVGTIRVRICIVYMSRMRVGVRDSIRLSLEMGVYA